MRDYYDILGVSKSADESTLKKAYRDLAMKYHPIETQTIKRQLINSKKLAKLMKFWRIEKKSCLWSIWPCSFWVWRSRSRWVSGFQGAGGFSDIFDDLFSEFTGGGGRSQRTSNRGSDLKYNLQVNLEEAYSGLEKTIKIKAPAKCTYWMDQEQKVEVQTFKPVQLAEEVEK